MSAKKPEIDWERIEVQYRTGAMSVREIAAEHGITHGAINKRAKTREWTRDLSAKVQAKADALVSKQTVSKEVSVDTVATEKMAVEIEAQVQARIRLAHRKDIGRARDLTNRLLGELEKQTDDPELFEKLLNAVLEAVGDEMGDSKAASDRRVKLWEQWNKAMGLAGRVDTMKKLAETLKVLIDKERESYGIEVKAQGAGAGNGLPTVTIRDLTGRKTAMGPVQ